MFRIFTTEEFDSDYDRLDGSERERVNKILRQLKDQGDSVGKELAGVSIFKEKKFNGKRLYFLVYQTFSVILVLAISDKKAQQATINRIIAHLADYQSYIIEELRKRSLIY
ncbi:MAG: hypothetical protein AABX16_02685 [Nanoarchaeota archaeon]